MSHKSWIYDISRQYGGRLAEMNYEIYVYGKHICNIHTSLYIIANTISDHFGRRLFQNMPK